MNNKNANVDLKSQRQANLQVLFLRWLLGAIVGIGISSWINFGLLNHTLEISPFLSGPFAGCIYLFDLDSRSFIHVSDFFVTFPVLICGLIGALLLSGNRKQIVAGVTLLILYIIVGHIVLFSALMGIPT